jgi:hypothetical protein
MSVHHAVKVRCAACNGGKVGVVTRHGQKCGCPERYEWPHGEPPWWLELVSFDAPFWDGPTRSRRILAPDGESVSVFCRSHGDRAFTRQQAATALSAGKDLVV